MKWYDSKAKSIARNSALRAAHLVAEDVLTESQKQVPLAEGTLQRSGTIDDDFPNGRVVISYNTPYALKQHEDMRLRHPDPTNPKSATGRKAKYLEGPLNMKKASGTKFIRAEVNKALRRSK